MATYKELNKLYKEYFNKDFPRSTLVSWRKSGKVKYSIATKEGQKELYNYDIESFKEIITSEEYKKKQRASKTKPQDYIGKTSGYLQIIDIVPKDKKNEPNYSGTLMYCKCLKCGRPDLI